MAEGILQTLIEIGETTVNEPENYDARGQSCMVGDACIEHPDWCGSAAGLGNGICRDELTAAFGIDHGQTLAIVLPALLEERREQKRAKLLQYAERGGTSKAAAKKIGSPRRSTRPGRSSRALASRPGSPSTASVLRSFQGSSNSCRPMACPSWVNEEMSRRT